MQNSQFLNLHIPPNALVNSIPFEQFHEKTDEADEEECIGVGFFY